MFRQRKPKRFNYNPRFSNENEEMSSDNEAQGSKEFLKEWREARRGKRKSRPIISMRTLLIVLVLLLICMYVLERKYIQ